MMEIFLVEFFLLNLCRMYFNCLSAKILCFCKETFLIKPLSQLFYIYNYLLQKISEIIKWKRSGRIEEKILNGEIK